MVPQLHIFKLAKQWLTLGLLLGLTWLIKVPVCLAQEGRFDLHPSEAQQVIISIQQIQDQDAGIRWEAVNKLREIGTEVAVEPLIIALQDDNSGVRRSAADALGEIGSEVAVEPLIIALQDDNLDVQKSSSNALSKIGKAAVNHLIPLLQTSDDWIRINAVEVLGEIGSERAVEPLIMLLQDQNLWIRRSAVYSLGSIGSEVAIDSLITALQDPASGVRERAADVLGSIGSEVAIDSLITALQDPASGMRERVAAALGRIGSEVAVDSLITIAFEDPDTSVRESAAAALGRIDSERAFKSLIAIALKDSNPEVRGIAATALGRSRFQKMIKNNAGLLVRGLRKSKDSTVRGLLMTALRRHQDSSITAAFIDRLSTPAETRRNRYYAISSLTIRHHLQNLSNSSELLETLSSLTLRDGEDHLIRYGAFILLSSVNSTESINFLDAHESEVLELIEANYMANLPFYLPYPLSSAQEEPPNPFEELTIIAAIDPYEVPANGLPADVFQLPIIPSIPQGADPSETQKEVITHLAGKPAICRFPWVTKNWSRCHD